MLSEYKKNVINDPVLVQIAIFITFLFRSDVWRSRFIFLESETPNITCAKYEYQTVEFCTSLMLCQDCQVSVGVSVDAFGISSERYGCDPLLVQCSVSYSYCSDGSARISPGRPRRRRAWWAEHRGSANAIKNRVSLMPMPQTLALDR